jgi:hypothetical protein
MTADHKVTVLVQARNRPPYLWAALDSLYRATAHPHRFVLVDMASEDAAVRQVLAGFERRRMFDEVVRLPRNEAADYWKLIWRMLPGLGPYFVHVETDVVVAETVPCWLGRLVELMEANPRLAMLGSAIDRRDFVALDEARRLAPAADERQLRNLIKYDSPERDQDPAAAAGRPVFRPHSPAGRLVMLRSHALARVGADNDGGLDRKFAAAGYETGVAAAVRHRHLSLLHLYDYPDYDYDARHSYLYARPRPVSE